MKMILHGMKRSEQEPERSHTVLLQSQEEAWKMLVNFQEEQIVYVVLADAAGHVVWQTRGSVSDAKSAELEAAVARLTNHSKQR